MCDVTVSNFLEHNARFKPPEAIYVDSVNFLPRESEAVHMATSVADLAVAVVGLPVFFIVLLSSRALSSHGGRSRMWPH